MPFGSDPTHRHRRLFPLQTTLRGAALLGLTAMLAACAADVDAPAEPDAPVLGLFSAGNWVRSASGKPIPSDAFPGGEVIGPLDEGYVCRYQFGNDLLPGKLHANRCHVGYQGDEFRSSSFEVLLRGSYSWTSETPKDPVVGGMEHGKPVYICQAEVRGLERGFAGTSYLPGKLVDGVCYATYDGDETAYTGSNMRVLDRW